MQTKVRVEKETPAFPFKKASGHTGGPQVHQWTSGWVGLVHARDIVSRDESQEQAPFRYRGYVAFLVELCRIYTKPDVGKVSGKAAAPNF